jgi:cell division initiation protein
MDISPNQILEKKFRTRFKGYDPDEVDSYLEEISMVMTSMIKEQNAMKDRLVRDETQLADLKKKEEEFREALTSAYKLSEETKLQAQKKADLIVEKAKLDADRIVAGAHQEVTQLEERISRLRRIQREAEHKIRAVLEGYLQIIDEETLPPEEIDQALSSAKTEIKAIQENYGDSSEKTDTIANNEKETYK